MVQAFPDGWPCSWAPVATANLYTKGRWGGTRGLERVAQLRVVPRDKCTGKQYFSIVLRSSCERESLRKERPAAGGRSPGSGRDSSWVSAAVHRTMVEIDIVDCLGGQHAPQVVDQEAHLLPGESPAISLDTT